MGEPEVFEDAETGCIEYWVGYFNGDKMIAFSAVEQYDDAMSEYQKTIKTLRLLT